MENSPLLKRKLYRVLWASLIGVTLSDLMLVADNLANDLWRHGHLSKAPYDFVASIAVLMCIPSAYVIEAIGFQGGLVNEYLVNGVLGILLFGSVYPIWQFLMKGPNES